MKFHILGLVDHNAEDEEGEGIVLQSRNPWEGSDRDYEYEEVYLLFMFYKRSFFIDVVELIELQSVIMNFSYLAFATNDLLDSC